MGATNGLRASLRETEALNFSLPNQIFHSTSNIFDGNIQVNAMLIKEIDDIDFQALERCLGN